MNQLNGEVHNARDNANFQGATQRGVPVGGIGAGGVDHLHAAYGERYQACPLKVAFKC